MWCEMHVNLQDSHGTSAESYPITCTLMCFLILWSRYILIFKARMKPKVYFAANSGDKVDTTNSESDLHDKAHYQQEETLRQLLR